MNYSLKSNRLKSSCPKTTAFSAALRYLGARGKIVTTKSWAKLSPQNIPYYNQEVPCVCKRLPLPKKQQVQQTPSSASEGASHSTPLESKELPSGCEILGQQQVMIQARGV